MADKWSGATAKLEEAYAAYLVVEPDGDWETFVDWVDDEDPGGVRQRPRGLGTEFDEDEPAEAPAVDDLSEVEVCARCGEEWRVHTLETMPPKSERCEGFECSTDHDAAGTECPLRRPPVHDEIAAEIAEAAERDACWGYAETEDADFWSGACSTREAVIDEARSNLGKNATFWIRNGSKAIAAHFLPTFRQFEENMGQEAVDNGCPDEVDDAFIIADGAEEALEDFLLDWAEKYVETNWWVPDGKPEKIAPDLSDAEVRQAIADLEPSEDPREVGYAPSDGVAKAMAGGDSLARVGGPPPETEFEG